MEGHLNRKIDLPAAIALVFTLWISAWRLQATHWTRDLNLIPFMVFFAVCLGLLFGTSVLRRHVVAILAFGYSLVMLTWRLGMILPAGIELREKLLSLGGRLGVTLWQTFHRYPVEDPILFITTMMVLFWVLSLWGAILLVQTRKPWLPIAIAGIALLSFEINSPTVRYHERYIAGFVFCLLFLIYRVNYLSSRVIWEKRGVSIDYETGFDLGRSAIVVGLTLVLIVWNLPAFFNFFAPGVQAQQRATESWAKMRERFRNLVISLENPSGFGGDFANNSLELGTGASVGDAAVFNVTPSVETPIGFRYYWRSRTYDIYENSMWENSTPKLDKTIQPDAWPLKVLTPGDERRVVATYRLISPTLRSLPLPGVPIKVSRPVEVFGEETPDEKMDISAIIATPYLLSGESFEITASINAPTVAEMRKAGTEYPEWVKARYLRLPEKMPRSIQTLAFQLAGEIENPYDQVVAITKYLRENMTYSEKVEQPVDGKDPLVWFLFYSKTGFCNYYASSEILLLRSLGIPARLSAGYSQGDYDKDSKTYTVRMKNSHAWPEVFFPKIGWVPFEPTTAQPDMEYLPGQESQANENAQAGNEGDVFDRPGLDERLRDRELEEGPEIGTGAANTRRLVWFWSGLAFSLALMGISLWFLSKRKGARRYAFPIALEHNLKRRGWNVPAWLEHWARFSELDPIERVFKTVVWLIHIDGVKFDPGATPAELIAILQMKHPSIDTDSRELLNEYHRTVFSPEPGNYIRARDAAVKIWRTTFFDRVSEITGIRSEKTLSV